MAPVNLIVFDLDGTLLDSQQSICHVVNLTREHFGLAALTDQQILAEVGIGVPHLINQTMLPDGTAYQVVENYFLRAYNDLEAKHGALYSGAIEVMDTLLAQGRQLGLCTNKPLIPTIAALKQTNITDHFVKVVAGDSLATRKPHPEGLNLIIEAAGVAADQAIMVGDTEVDIQTGKKAGVRTVACNYGMRSAEEMAATDADYTIDCIGDLLAIFMK